jgi:adenylosuccinate synthase
MARISVIIGLGFGDEGKGSITDFITREKGAKLVVRFNGGSQAGHNVRGPDWTHHCFSQWGAGTLSGARTHLSKYMLVNPIFAFAEARHLQSIGVKDPFRLLTIDEDAPLTTPFQVAANRLKELARGDGRHGSCGMGIGETMSTLLNHDDSVFAYMMKNGRVLQALQAQQERYRAEVKALDLDMSNPVVQQEMLVLEDLYTLDTCLETFAAFTDRVQIVGRSWFQKELHDPGHIVFEGAQGVLLDENWGFHPNTTWSTCTFNNAVELIKDAKVEAEYLGVLRTYATRHGAGPFPTERDAYKSFIKHDHNVPTPWQKDMRAGPLDLVLAKYAVKVAPQITGLVLTHMDVATDTMQVCMAYRGDKDHELGIPSPMLHGAWPIITGIGIGNGRVDLNRQERIGKALTTVKPLYETVERKELPSLVSEALGIPIEIVSSGWRAKDKERL